MKALIHKILKERGRQIIAYPDSKQIRKRVTMEYQKIDTVLDIGANTGQYGLQLRQYGYSKKIISFEPMSAAYQVLRETAANDIAWDTKHYALGNQTSSAIINISANSFSSSILNMLPAHVDGAPESKYIATEDIEVKKLDDIYDELCGVHANVMMKIDTQGFEKNVLDGAKESIKNIRIIELEMSLTPLYENEMLFIDMVKFLQDIGFELFDLEHVFSNPKTGQLLQVDGRFVRKQ